MNNIIKIIKILLLKLLIITFLLNCAKTDEVTGEKVLKETNIREKAAKSPGIFGDIGGKKDSNTFDFATSNILWRATLKTLSFIPLNNADYSGGVIVTDWYSEDLNSKEQIKIFVNFNSSELRSDSLNITAHKKICLTNENCKITKLQDSYVNEIKDSIINTARKIRIEEEKIKK